MAVPIQERYLKWMAIVVNLLVLMFLLVMPTCPNKAIMPFSGGEDRNNLAAVAATLLAVSVKPRCSLLLFADDHTSQPEVTQMVDVLRSGAKNSDWGTSVFQVTEGGSHNNTRQKLSTLLHLVHQGVREWWCVTIMVVSDDWNFLATWANQASSYGLLAWPRQILAFTHYPLPPQAAQSQFSMANAIIVTCRSLARCDVLSYPPYSPHQAQVVQMARWSPSCGLIYVSHDTTLFPNKFHQFSQRPTLVVAAEEFQPNVLVKKVPSEADWASRQVPGEAGETNFTMVGPMATLLHILAHSLNFSFAYKRPPDGAWGILRQDGTWTGMVGMVIYKKVDMGLGPFSLNKARAELLDFTEPIITDYLRILARKGSPEVDQWGFLLPLTPVVWEAFLGSLVILLVAVYLLGFFVLHEDPHQSVRLDATFLVYLRVFLQQDIHTESLKWWSRLALGSWMLLTLVITRSYAGQLMSTLAVRFIPQPFHTLKALLDNPTTTMIWEANTAFVEHYKASKSGDLVRVLEADRKGIIRFIKTVDVTFAMDQLVRAGKHAVILENLTTRDLMAIDFSHKGRCDFYSSREPFMLFMNGLIAPRHSAIIQSMSKRIVAVLESGLYDHWLSMAIPNSTTCLTPPTTTTVTSPLALTNTWGMFVMFVGGLLLALVILFMELVMVCQP